RVGSGIPEGGVGAGPYGEDGGVRGDAEGVAVGGDEAGHRGAVAVSVLQRVGALLICEVDAGEEAAGEGGVAAVDAGVDDADDEAVAGADLVDLFDVEDVQVPLLGANVLLHRQPGDGEQAGQGSGRELLQQSGWGGEHRHRSIPITPGPGSCSAGSAGGWIT